MRKKFLVKQKYLLILKIKNKMKNLQEMSLQEMKETEGGSIWRFLGPIGIAIAVYDALSDMHEGFVENYKQR